MKKFDTLFETWLDSKKVKGETIELFINPTTKELSGISNGDIRGYINPNGKIYVISKNPEDFIHSELLQKIKQFGAKLPKPVLNSISMDLDDVYGDMMDANPSDVGLLININNMHVSFSESYFEFDLDGDEWYEKYDKDLKQLIAKSKQQNKGMKFGM